MTGCIDELTQNGDLDFDGTPYWPEWPTGTTPTIYPSTFVQSLPVTDSGQQYSEFFIQTDLALSESTCTASGAGCSVPPPNAPGHFYPYWSRALSSGSGQAPGREQQKCVIEFGNVSRGVNDFGGDAQYGTDQQAALGYPEFEGPDMPNSCAGT